MFYDSGIRSLKGREEEVYAPWKRNSPTIFEARPKDPTITTSFGFEISIDMSAYCRLILNGTSQNGHLPGVLKKRSKASMVIEKQSASRKTPLTRAARISALCHP